MSSAKEIKQIDEKQLQLQYTEAINQIQSKLISLINVYKNDTHITLKEQLLEVISSTIDTLNDKLESFVVKESKSKRELNNKYYIVNKIVNPKSSETVLYECDKKGRLMYGGNCEYDMYDIFNDKDVTDEQVAELIKSIKLY